MELQKSDSIAKLTEALVSFKKVVPTIGKGSENPFYKSKYASLPDILHAIDPILVECGLAITQFPIGEHGLCTLLAHTSGEYVMATYDMHPKDNSPQGIGSAITYQRRYALAAVLSLNIDEDDDGNKASASPVRSAVAKEKAKPVEKEIPRSLNAITIKIVDIQTTSKGDGKPLTTKTGKTYRVIWALDGNKYIYYGSSDLEKGAFYSVTYRESNGFLTIDDLAPGGVDLAIPEDGEDTGDTYQ